MPEVLAIEHASFEYPWCEEEFLRVLRQRNCIGMVAEYGERIVGFMIYELHRNKIHVLDFATHPEFRRRGRRPPDDPEARRQALGPAPQPDRAVRSRDEPGRAALLPGLGLPRHRGRPRALPRHGRGRLSSCTTTWTSPSSRRSGSRPTGSPSSSAVDRSDRPGRPGVPFPGLPHRPRNQRRLRTSVARAPTGGRRPARRGPRAYSPARRRLAAGRAAADPE